MLKIQQEHLARLLKKARIYDERTTMHTEKQWEFCVEAVATACSAHTVQFNTKKFYATCGYTEPSIDMWNCDESEE
jgi:hypothetical protein